MISALAVIWIKKYALNYQDAFITVFISQPG